MHVDAELRRKFDNFNVSLEQLAWDGRAGVEIAYDRQNYGTDSFAAYHAGAERIFLDVNPTLLHPTATVLVLKTDNEIPKE